MGKLIHYYMDMSLMYLQRCQMPLSAPLSDVHHILNQDMTLAIVTKIHSVICNLFLLTLVTCRQGPSKQMSGDC